MEFNKIFNTFTITAVIIMLLTTLVSVGFAISERAKTNLGVYNSCESLEYLTINHPCY